MNAAGDICYANKKFLKFKVNKGTFNKLSIKQCIFKSNQIAYKQENLCNSYVLLQGINNKIKYNTNIYTIIKCILNYTNITSNSCTIICVQLSRSTTIIIVYPHISKYKQLIKKYTYKKK